MYDRINVDMYKDNPFGACAIRSENENNDERLIYGDSKARETRSIR